MSKQPVLGTNIPLLDTPFIHTFWRRILYNDMERGFETSILEVHMKRGAVAFSVTLIAAVLAVSFAGSGCGDKAVTPTGPVTTTPTPTSPDIPVGKSPLEIYLMKGEEPVPVKRDVAGGAQEALLTLLKGPSDVEKQEGLHTAIPEGTRLNGYSIEGDRAKADFSRELLNYGGGSANVAAITGQITRTVLANEPRAITVAITVDGAPAEEVLQP